MNDDKFLIISSENLAELIERLIKDAGLEQKVEESLWITTEETMSLMGIKSKTTLYNLRSAGKIEYSEVTPKNFLYNRASVLFYIHSKTQKAFYYED